MASSAPTARMPLLLLLLCLSAGPRVHAQFAIPARYDGFALSGPKSTHPVVIEAFFDLLCPSCRDAWPVLRAVSHSYPKTAVQIIVHPFPAPFHHNAYFAARGMHIAASLNASLAYPWMEAVYKNQDVFGGDVTANEAPRLVIARLAALAPQLGLDEGAFLDGFSDLQTDSLTRTSFKYGCSRGVVATPTFLVNGVAVQGADDTWMLRDWEALLDPFLPQAAAGGRAAA